MFSEVYCASEKRVKEIIQTLNDNVYSSMRKCAKEIKLNHKTLNNWWNEKASKFIQENINKRLFIAQERAIKNYIIRMNAKNMSLTLKLIEEIINFVLRETDLNATFVRIYWIKKYFDRNFDFKRRRQRLWNCVQTCNKCFYINAQNSLKELLCKTVFLKNIKP